LKRKLPAGFQGELDFASIPTIKTLPQPLQDQVKHAFADSLKVVWAVMTGVVLLGLLVSLFMRHYTLTENVDEKWTAKEATANQVNGENSAEKSENLSTK
jgi:flagellar biosynthesis/type III secretory pathway M-ring protein FliF/YscJ